MWQTRLRENPYSNKYMERVKLRGLQERKKRVMNQTNFMNHMIRISHMSPMSQISIILIMRNKQRMSCITQIRKVLIIKSQERRCKKNKFVNIPKEIEFLLLNTGKANELCTTRIDSL